MALRVGSDRLPAMSDHRWPWHVALGRIIIALTIIWGLVAFGIYKARGEEVVKPHPTALQLDRKDRLINAIELQRNEALTRFAFCNADLGQRSDELQDLRQKLAEMEKKAADHAAAAKDNIIAEPKKD